MYELHVKLAALFALRRRRPPRSARIPSAWTPTGMWDRWPYQRIGARAYMRSTYDRAGGNERADASHFLYQLADDFNVTLDVEGPGHPLLRPLQPLARQPLALRGGRQGPHGAAKPARPIPMHPAPNSVFLPRELFPRPLAWTWADTKGARPVVGADRLREVVPHGLLADLLRHRLLHLPPVRRRREALAADRVLGRKTPPRQDVLDLIARAGTDIAPAAGLIRRSGQARLSGAAAPVGRRAAAPA